MQCISRWAKYAWCLHMQPSRMLQSAQQQHTHSALPVPMAYNSTLRQSCCVQRQLLAVQTPQFTPSRHTLQTLSQDHSLEHALVSSKVLSQLCCSDLLPWRELAPGSPVCCLCTIRTLPWFQVLCTLKRHKCDVRGWQCLIAKGQLQFVKVVCAYGCH